MGGAQWRGSIPEGRDGAGPGWYPRAAMTEPATLPWTTTLEGLPLRRATDPAWIDVARADLNGLLVDHAHCEQKAASVALSLIGRCADNPDVVRKMLALAHEEMHHFRQVLDLLERRGGALTKPLPDPYVKRLRDWSFQHRGGIGTRVDLFLASAFVEARSCERFRILASAFHADEDPGTRELGTFYLRLADAEGRHWEMFRDLAFAEGPVGLVEKRLDAMAEAEGEIVASLPVKPRMH